MNRYLFASTALILGCGGSSVTIAGPPQDAGTSETSSDSGISIDASGMRWDCHADPAPGYCTCTLDLATDPTPSIVNTTTCDISTCCQLRAQTPAPQYYCTCAPIMSGQTCPFTGITSGSPGQTITPVNSCPVP